jgi:glycosyltransferase involved in cell wall biosynthesis
MKVLLFGNHETGDGWPRLPVLIEGLRARGVGVEEVRVPFLPSSEARRKAASSPFAFLAAGARAAAALARLRSAYRAAPEHDAVLVGYPGALAVRVARAANRRAGRPVVLDAFLSLWDTAVNDRGLAGPRSLRARALKRIDRSSCAAADLVLVDTEENARFFAAELGADPERLLAVPVGALPFRAPAPPPRPPGAPLEVLFFGTFVPLQGAGAIVEAAGRLRGSGVRLSMIGTGQDLPAARERARALRLLPPEFEAVESFLPRAELDRRIAAADACLGIFGTTPKAARVVPCKVHDSLAAGKPVVTADTPAARSLLRDGESALLVPAGDPEALAAAILRLRDDPALRGRLAAGAKRVWGERLRPDRVVEGLVQALEARCPARRRTG